MAKQAADDKKCKYCNNSWFPGHRCGKNGTFGSLGKAKTNVGTNNNTRHNNMQVNHLTEQTSSTVDASTSAEHPGDQAIDSMDVDGDNGSIISLGELENQEFDEDHARAAAGKFLLTTNLHANPYLELMT